MRWVKITLPMIKFIVRIGAGSIIQAFNQNCPQI